MGVAYYHKDKVNSKLHLHKELAEFMLKKNKPRKIWITVKHYHKNQKSLIQQFIFQAEQ